METPNSLIAKSLNGTPLNSTSLNESLDSTSDAIVIEGIEFNTIQNYVLCLFKRDYNGAVTTVYNNYYFEPENSTLVMQLFILCIQILFTMALMYYVFGESYNEIEYKNNVFNNIFAVIIVNLTCSKLLPPIRTLKHDIRIIMQYFSFSYFNHT